MNDQRQREAALRRRAPLSAQRLAEIAADHEGHTDWYSWCPTCEATLYGTLAELRAHECPGAP